MEERQCKQCERSLTGLREDAKFCQKKCRNKYNKRRQRILDKIRTIQGRITSENEFQRIKTEEIIDIKAQRKRLPELNKKLEEYQVIQVKIQILNTMSFEEIKTRHYNWLQKNKDSDQYLNWNLGNTEDRERIVYGLFDEFERRLDILKIAIHEIRSELDELKRKTPDQYIERLEARIEKSKHEVATLEGELKELESTDLDNLPTQPDPMTSATRDSKSKVNRPFVQGLSGDQILKMDFNGVKLSGELGNFFGNLQRDRCAIALTGDAGVGKSTFSFEITKHFVEKKLSVAYFALETGISKSVQKLIAEHDLGKYDFKAFGEGSLNDVRYHAGKHDCVVIDSYSKISSKPQDFEDLRQDFPDTFFIIIFQKTTDGKIRGGSSIFFNCTASIDLQISSGGHRLALMQKSRYDTENFVYSIDNKVLLKWTKLPIKWSEIKERWDEK